MAEVSLRSLPPPPKKGCKQSPCRSLEPNYRGPFFPARFTDSGFQDVAFQLVFLKGPPPPSRRGPLRECVGKEEHDALSGVPAAPGNLVRAFSSKWLRKAVAAGSSSFLAGSERQLMQPARCISPSPPAPSPSPSSFFIEIGAREDDTGTEWGTCLTLLGLWSTPRKPDPGRVALLPAGGICKPRSAAGTVTAAHCPAGLSSSLRPPRPQDPSCPPAL